MTDSCKSKMWSSTLVLMTSLAVCLQAVSGQVFRFPTPVTFQTSCGLAASLSVDGSVTLTYDDLDRDHFTPAVYIKTSTSDICTIDLANCVSEGPTVGQNICVCTQQSATEFRLFVRKSVSASLSGIMLHAELHHQDPSNPPTVSADIGVLAAVSTGSGCGASPRQVCTTAGGTQALCDTATDGGNWVVFQRRSSAQVSFDQDWDSYTRGFGNLDVDGNFWWGLSNVYSLCSKSCELRIDLKYGGKDYYAAYQNFSLGSVADNFRLHVSGYHGNAGDVLTIRGHNNAFSTFDRDHDTYGGNCASEYHGGWWFDACHGGNLNGLWGDVHYGQGMDWLPLTDFYHSVTFSEMKVRPNSGNAVIGK